jgi:glycine/D-amino acid oxidase-like deaminating enzyme
MYYGFPRIDEKGVKVGCHDPGAVCTPQTIDRTVNDDEVAVLQGVLDTFLPGAAHRLLATATCMYTMTPDHHFILEQHKENKQIAYVCGLSGHGFKFAGVIGEILADLSVSGKTAMPIGFLSSNRASLSLNSVH